MRRWIFNTVIMATRVTTTTFTVIIRCGRVATARLDDTLKAANSLVGPSSKDAHRGVYGARTLIQTRRKMHTRTDEHRQKHKHTSGDRLCRKSYDEACAPCGKVVRQSGSPEVRVTAAAVTDVWDCAVLGREKRDDLVSNRQ